MISAEDIVSLVTAGISDAEVLLEDLTGGQDHWKAIIVSDAFDGLSSEAAPVGLRNSSRTA